MQGLKPASWPEALQAVKKGLQNAKGNEIAAIAGKLADAESIMALKVHSFLPETLRTPEYVHCTSQSSFKAIDAVSPLIVRS